MVFALAYDFCCFLKASNSYAKYGPILRDGGREYGCGSSDGSISLRMTTSLSQDIQLTFLYRKLYNNKLIQVSIEILPQEFLSSSRFSLLLQRCQCFESLLQHLQFIIDKVSQWSQFHSVQLIANFFLDLIQRLLPQFFLNVNLAHYMYINYGLNYLLRKLG